MRRVRRRGALADRRPAPRGKTDDRAADRRQTGAPDVLLEAYPGRLEYHAPWHPAARGLPPVSRACRCRRGGPAAGGRPATGTCGSSTTGSSTRRSEALCPALDHVRCYHLLPGGVSKAAGIEFQPAPHADSRPRGDDRGRRLARGPRLRAGGRALLPRANAVERDPAIRDALALTRTSRLREERTARASTRRSSLRSQAPSRRGPARQACQAPRGAAIGPGGDRRADERDPVIERQSPRSAGRGRRSRAPGIPARSIAEASSGTDSRASTA